MDVKILNSEKSLSAEEINQAETRVSVKFPDAYRQFLLKHNGGYPKPSGFNFKCEGEAPQPAMVAYFLAIYEGENENFFDYFETYQERIPAELVPVARDPGGNLILLGVKGNYTGKVYFWKQDLEPEEPDFSNVCPIADDFNKFLDSFFELDE